jgi:hypothetical protein
MNVSTSITLSVNVSLGKSNIGKMSFTDTYRAT